MAAQGFPAPRTSFDEPIGFLSCRHINRSKWGRKSLYLRFTAVAALAAFLISGSTFLFLPQQAALIVVLGAVVGAVFGGIVSLVSFYADRCRSRKQRCWRLSGMLAFVVVFGIIFSPLGPLPVTGRVTEAAGLAVWMGYVAVFMVAVIAGWCLSWRCLPPKNLRAPRRD